MRLTSTKNLLTKLGIPWDRYLRLGGSEAEESQLNVWGDMSDLLAGSIELHWGDNSCMRLLINNTSPFGF